MATENQTKISNRLAAMPNKQKAMIGVVIVVVAIIIWQVIGLFGGGASTPASVPPVKPVKAMSANSPAGGGAMPGNQINSAMTNPGTSMPQNFNPQMMQPPSMSMPTMPNQAPANPQEKDLMALQQQAQVNYLKAVNELQMLKIQREIAETKQAISTATLATVTADKNMSNLLTPVIPPPPVVPPSAYANSLVAPTENAEKGPIGTPPLTRVPSSAGPSAPTIPVATPYVVISVSMQFNNWSAVLGYEGKFYSVSIGDTLPVDGSVVASISKSGVVLEKEGKRRRITILTSI